MLNVYLSHILLLIGALILPVATAEVAAWFQCPNDATLAPAVIKGKRFFNEQTGAYLPIKGIAYYPRPNAGPLSVSNSVDFFTEEFRDRWEPDIENFKRLGVNSIRIYGVDPSQNHDAFMCALQEAGIYVMIGLLADCENCGIGPGGPDEGDGCYPPTLKARGQYIITTFSKYNNTLAFSAGNEVALYARDRITELNAPCQKQFLRDMRAYVQTCSQVTNSVLPRRVPIGVVTADFDREINALYYSCRSDPDDELENAEWYGLNAYQHCDGTSTSIDQMPGYIKMRQDFEGYSLPIPVLLAEFGCRERGFPTIEGFEAQRTWLQVDALYSPAYADVFAGGMVFEYSAEKKYADESAQGNPFPYNEFMKLNYGVGYFLPEDCDITETPCVYNEYPEYELLAIKMSSLDSSGVPSMQDYTVDTDLDFPECPVEIAPPSLFTWPSDEQEDLECYVIITPAPTEEPSSAPTIAPTTTAQAEAISRDRSIATRQVLDVLPIAMLWTALFLF
jgi:hypothetical protein